MALGIYLHLTYCLSKCPYCDFASQVESRIPQQRYADAIRRELALRQGELEGRTAMSLYIGGGTPSPWEPEQLNEVLSAIRSAIPFEEDAELTDHVGRSGDDAGGRSGAGRQRRRGGFGSAIQPFPQAWRRTGPETSTWLIRKTTPSARSRPAGW